jgi:hypothetical protein
MNCRTAREQLNLLIAGERLERGRLYVAVARHWLGCAGCRAAGRRLGRDRRVARRLPVPPPPPGLRVRVMAELPPAGASSPTLAWSPRGRQVAIFAGAAALLAVVLGRWGGQAVKDHVVNRGTMARVDPSPQPPPRSGEGEPVSSLSPARSGRHRGYWSAGVRSGSISPLRFGEGLGEGLTPAMPPDTSDQAALSGDESATARPWVALSRSDPGVVERQIRRVVPVGDDFVQIPFPRLASTSERQIAQAVEDYQKEAAVVDARLAREVTLQQKATALSDLCERLRGDTGIQLAAGQSVADEKVTLFCEKRPLRDVMRQLSRPFGYTWLRGGKQAEYKYELVQDLRSQLLEEELRNRDRNAALLALEREIDRYRPYLSLSPDEALARARTAPPDEKPLLEKLATDGWGPIQMYFRLSRQDLAVLRAGQRVTFSAEPRPGERPLPPDLARGILACQRNVRLIRGENGLEFASDRTDPRSLSLVSVPEVRAQVRLEISESELGQFTLAGSAGLFTTPEARPSGSGGHPQPLWSLSSSGPWAAGTDPASVKPDNPLANARLARDPVLRVRVTVRPRPSCGGDLSPPGTGPRRWPLRGQDAAPPPLPKRGGVPDAGYGLPAAKGPQPRDSGDREDKLPLPASGRGLGGEVTPPKVTTADVLEALHRSTGMPIVADYYTRLFAADTASVQAMPLFEALDRLADATRLRWNKEGDWLQFRSASFFNDRLKEVPNRLLTHWAASRRQHGALTLEDVVEIAQLPDAQLDADDVAEGAKECFGLAEWTLGRKRLLRPHLRYLAGLTPAQRQAALSSTGLPFTGMSLSQQQEFIAHALLPGAEPLGSVDELAGAALRVEYSQPGRFEWRVPGPPWLQWVAPLEPGRQSQRVLRPVVQEPTWGAALQKLRRVDPQIREAVLQAAGRADPRIAQAPPAEEAQIAPTQRSLVIIYVPGGSNARPLHVITDDGNELAPPTW